MDKLRTHLRNWLPWGLIGLGIALGGLAVVMSHKTPKPQSSPPQSQTDQPAVASAKPKAQEVATYTVALDVPKFIAIPKINLDKARVRGLGIGKKNQVAVPDNIYDAGWYNASAKPGQAGAMFIYGHISNWDAHGLFYDLKKLKQGDTITITRGDDKTFTYRVVAAEQYLADAVPMDKVLAPIDTRPGLNLMTCAGSLVKGTNEFSERLVVYTTQVGS